MTAEQASNKLANAIKYNNGKIATTQLEQIMITCIDPSQRPYWRNMIRIGLKSESYADTIFALKKLDNSYHQILAIRDMATQKTVWKFN